MSSPLTFTRHGWVVCLWALVVPFQYGYHISVLNQIQAVIVCKPSSPAPDRGLPSCFHITDFTFSLITVIFTIGGLAGSLVANLVMDRWGRRGTHRTCAVFFVFGTLFMAFSSSVAFLLVGRFLVGIGSGLGLCVGPIFLAEIAPSKISGSVGVLTQLSIVLGIMLTQIAGFNLATPTLWRVVFLISSALSAVQIMFSSLVVESPTWLLRKGRLEESKVAAMDLWGPTIPLLAGEESLLVDSEHTSGTLRQDNATISQIFAMPNLRRPLLIVCFAMLAQQVSGINAGYLAIFLEAFNDILAKSLPEFGPYISLGITVINVIMTFPPIVLIERAGRKTLLMLSTMGALVSLAVVGFGLNTGASALASLAIITFVMSFAVGLGPIPFVLIPEVSPSHAVSALSSIALSVNWIANFIVGLVFLPLRNLLAGGDMYKEGRVFYLFVVALAVSAVLLFRQYSRII